MHRCVQFLPELLDTVVDAVQIRTEAHHLVDRCGGFLNMDIVHAAEPQLLSMEGGSIGAVDGASGAKGNEGLLTSVQGGITQ